MITKVDERTGGRAVSHTAPIDTSHGVDESRLTRPIMTQHHLRCQGGGRTEGGDLEGGRGARIAGMGGGCGTERSEELNAKMLHNSPLVFPTGRFIIQEKKRNTSTTIRYRLLTGSSERPRSAHIPTQNLEADFFLKKFMISFFQSCGY